MTIELSPVHGRVVEKPPPVLPEVVSSTIHIINADQMFDTPEGKRIKGSSLSTSHMRSFNSVVRTVFNMERRIGGKAAPRIYRTILDIIADHNQTSPHEIHPIMIVERNGKKRYLLPESEVDTTIMALRENKERIESSLSKKQDPMRFLRNTRLRQFFTQNPPDSEEVQSILAQLTPKQQEVFIPHYLEGLSRGKVASIVGISPNAAGRRFRASIRRLEKAITRPEPEETKRKVIKRQLSSRQITVLQKRFGLEWNEGQSLSQVGKELSVTREDIRQIEARALRKLGLSRNVPKEQLLQSVREALAHLSTT